MILNDEAVLLVVQNRKDADGFPVDDPEVEEIPVFVHVKSATRSEFYAALRENVRVQTVFVMRVEDWELSAHMEGRRKAYATQIKYDGAVYNIIRAYRMDRYMVEVVCS